LGQGRATTRITQQHYEHALPDEALRGMKMFESKVADVNPKTLWK